MALMTQLKDVSEMVGEDPSPAMRATVTPVLIPFYRPAGRRRVTSLTRKRKRGRSPV